MVCAHANGRSENQDLANRTTNRQVCLRKNQKYEFAGFILPILCL